tara:strand:+ start:326 stop:562 length:237 start_codon:yes stop_codon:yes gene_type:complete
MPQTLFKRRDDEVKRNGVPFHSRPPISRNVSYGMHQRHLNDKEEELMKKYKCGYSTLVKHLIAERYNEEFNTKKITLI